MVIVETDSCRRRGHSRLIRLRDSEINVASFLQINATHLALDATSWTRMSERTRADDETSIFPRNVRPRRLIKYYEKLRAESGEGRSRSRLSPSFSLPLLCMCACVCARARESVSESILILWGLLMA